MDDALADKTRGKRNTSQNPLLWSSTLVRGKARYGQERCAAQTPRAALTAIWQACARAAATPSTCSKNRTWAACPS